MFYLFLELINAQQVNGGDSLSLPLTAELDNLKAEILQEIRTEVQKAKQEILDGEWWWWWFDG